MLCNFIKSERRFQFFLSLCHQSYSQDIIRFPGEREREERKKEKEFLYGNILCNKMEMLFPIYVNFDLILRDMRYLFLRIFLHSWSWRLPILLRINLKLYAKPIIKLYYMKLEIKIKLYYIIWKLAIFSDFSIQLCEKIKRIIILIVSKYRSFIILFLISPFSFIYNFQD